MRRKITQAGLGEFFHSSYFSEPAMHEAQGKVQQNWGLVKRLQGSVNIRTSCDKVKERASTKRDVIPLPSHLEDKQLAGESGPKRQWREQFLLEPRETKPDIKFTGNTSEGREARKKHCTTGGDIISENFGI